MGDNLSVQQHWSCDYVCTLHIVDLCTTLYDNIDLIDKFY